MAYLGWTIIRGSSTIARKAASKTKGRTPRQKAAPASVATDTAITAPRRGRKPKQRDEEPAELSLAEAFFPEGEQSASTPP